MQILFFALSYLIWSKMAASQTCPENLRSICTRKCAFLDGFLDLDCSPAQDLRELIKQLRSSNKPIRSLKMSENSNFVELPGKVFDTLKIKKLDLSSNGLTGISPRAFMGLEDTLTDLNLAANKLTSIPDVANLRLLESLDISGNQLTGGEVKHDLFTHNPKLHVVKIDPDKAIYLLQDKADKVSDFLPAAPASVAQAPSLQAVAAPPKIVDLTNSLNNPMNTLIFTSLLSDLLRNLPSIISGLQALQAISLRNNEAPAPLFPNLLGPVGKSPTTQLDAAKISPDFVHEVMANGGKIPGVPADVTAAMTQQYLQQMAKGNGEAAGQLTPMAAPATLTVTPAAPVPSPDKANVSLASTSGFSGLVRQFTDLLANPNAPLPPLDTLPADLVNKVLSGGLIPGINASQIEAIKTRYMEQLFGAPPPGQMTHASTIKPPQGITTTATPAVVATTTTTVSSSTSPTTPANTTNQGLATTMAPVLPTTVKILDKSFDVKTNEIQIADGRPIATITNDRIPLQKTPIQKVPDLDIPIDRPEQNSSSSNATLYIALALIFVSLATVALIVYFCYNLKRNKKRANNLEEPKVANSDRTIYIGTPPNSHFRRIPAISNIPRKMAPSTINDQSTFDSIRDSPPIFAKKTPISDILERKQSQVVKMVPPLFQSSPKKQDNVTRDTNDILSSATTTTANGLSRKWTISGPMGQNKF